ncbi:DUF732 domain-containing protein [Corynebacterium jeikeium]|uniref:DUF732 domain-containing protein n=1 Tax=Corynebacterium jeikeium TaxID=38289 RepID=UPI0001B7186C|nr:DUF732 domain-containing protein [Corynebacterium jeikeium]EEW16500.1 hypothetical protein HMPREF0297_1092 [Corynebacterium jeikeium ATCC 43734]OOD29885.1 hypothetical protein BWP03_08780 [Corynebacterium jeikeium]WCZ52683.1 hypothetical protein CJEIK_00690 [Corynebacterium jeikeium]SUY82011.1 putative secreted protein [Corynebacterium jeikeium]
MGVTKNRQFRAAAGAACAALLSLATLTACGGDETVDNSAESTTVPSVTESATETEKSDDAKDGKDGGDDKDGESGSSEGSDAPAPAGDRGGEPARDGAVDEVDDIPSGAQRSDQDKDFLKRLKDGGIDLTKANDAAEIGGLEDQVIAAGHAHCTAEGGGQADVYTPLAAGQLEANGVIDGDPKKAEDAIREAAKSAYC